MEKKYVPLYRDVIHHKNRNDKQIAFFYEYAKKVAKKRDAHKYLLGRSEAPKATQLHFLF